MDAQWQTLFAVLLGPAFGGSPALFPVSFAHLSGQAILVELEVVQCVQTELAQIYK